jgi:hypothetical protein
MLPYGTNKPHDNKGDGTSDVTEKAGRGGSGRSTSAAWIDLGGGFQCLLATKTCACPYRSLNAFGRARHVRSAVRPCFSRMERTIQNCGATRDGDSAGPTYPTRCAALWFRGCGGSRESGTSGRSSLESLRPAVTENGQAHRPKGPRVRPIKPCRFTHSSKGTQPLAEGELSLPQLVWQRQ